MMMDDEQEEGRVIRTCGRRGIFVEDGYVA